MIFTRILSGTLVSIIVSCTSLGRQGETKLSSADSKHCNGPGIRTIKLPVYPGKENSPEFTYRLKHSDSGDPVKPVIIFLPGGPGYPSMDESQSMGIPSGYRYILTDQRGTGCNNLADSNLPVDSFTSENMAEDVVAVIKSMHLDNYIIYGHSLGTIHATKVVAKIENEFRSVSRQRTPTALDIQMPKALVLEGTIGKAFPNGEGLQGSSDEWEHVKARLPNDVVEQLSREPLPFSNMMPSRSAASNWGNYINAMLNQGQFPARNGYGDLLMSLLALQQANSNPANYNALAQRVVASSFQGNFDIFLKVDCTELYDSFRGELMLQNGKLIAGGQNLCANNTTKPYDSSDYYISTPTYYFQGGSDPAAPTWQARHHFKSHGAASRKYIELRGVGHTPLQHSLFACKDQLWSAIIQGGDALLANLRQCPGVKSVAANDVEVNASEMYLKWSWN